MLFRDVPNQGVFYWRGLMYRKQGTYQAERVEKQWYGYATIGVAQTLPDNAVVEYITR